MPRAIANLLAGRHDITVVGRAWSRVPVKSSEEEKFTKIILPYSTNWLLRKKFPFSLRKKLLQLKPDLVVTEENFLPWTPSSLNRIVWARSPITCFRDVGRDFDSCSECMSFGNRFRLAVRKRFFKGVHVICNSNFTRERCLWPEAMAMQKVIYNGVDTEKYREIGKKNQILYLGRLYDVKGIESTIDAFRALQKDFPRTKLVIAGRGLPEDEERYRARAKGLNVDFLGYVEGKEKWRLYNESLLFVSPTQKKCEETFGIANAEAMACKLPVVACSTGGVSEVVLDGKTGFLVRPKDTGAVEESMRALLDDEKLRKRMGEAGRKRVLENFDIREIAKQHEAFYREVVG